eukprot:UN07347
MHKIYLLWATLLIGGVCLLAVIIRYVPATPNVLPNDEYEQKRFDINDKRQKMISESLLSSREEAI